VTNAETSNRFLRAYLPKDAIQRRILTFISVGPRTSHLSTFCSLLTSRRRSLPGTRCRNVRRSWIKRATHALLIQNTRHKHPPLTEVSAVVRGATFSPHSDFQPRYRRSHRQFLSLSTFSRMRTEIHELNLSLCVFCFITYADRTNCEYFRIINGRTKLRRNRLYPPSHIPLDSTLRSAWLILYAIKAKCGRTVSWDWH
jgi:hypothetical protein